MKIYKIILLTLFSLGMVLSSCNKENQFSNRLIKGDKWAVKRILIGSQVYLDFGLWRIIENEDIYESIPQATWVNGSSVSQFYWQFQDNGKNFKLNYINNCEICDETDFDPLDYFTYDLTGTYSVEKSSRKELIIESEETLGFEGQLVKIELEKR